MLTPKPHPENLDEMPLEHNFQVKRISGEEYRAKVLLDEYNSRCKVQRHEGQNLIRLIRDTLSLTREMGYTKISFLARETEWETFLSRGFVLEGIIKGYYLGLDGYIMSRFLEPQRRFSAHLEQEDQLMEEIMEKAPEVDLPHLPKGFAVKEVREEDAPILASFYREVFKSYPTPIFDEEYLVSEMKDGMVYKAIWDRGRLVSAGAADLDLTNKAAELTDCGTIPEYRGKGLITLLIQALEEELRENEFLTVFGMARSLSYGMNLVFRRFGYSYRGRLINHGHIAGKFEDLNIWVKKL